MSCPAPVGDYGKSRSNGLLHGGRSVNLFVPNCDGGQPVLSDHERPKSDDEKRDQWLVRFSRQVGRNLGPFFEAWGVPDVSSGTRLDP